MERWVRTGFLWISFLQFANCCWGYQVWQESERHCQDGLVEYYIVFQYIFVCLLVAWKLSGWSGGSCSRWSLFPSLPRISGQRTFIPCIFCPKETSVSNRAYVAFLRGDLEYLTFSLFHWSSCVSGAMWCWGRLYKESGNCLQFWRCIMILILSTLLKKKSQIWTTWKYWTPSFLACV